MIDCCEKRAGSAPDERTSAVAPRLLASEQAQREVSRLIVKVLPRGR